MNLVDANIDELYHIEKIELEVPTKRRLEALGLTEGTYITVLNRKKTGSLIFKVRGTRFAIGKKIADGIFIHKEEH